MASVSWVNGESFDRTKIYQKQLTLVFSSPIKAQCLPEGSEWPRITAETGPNDSEVPSPSNVACEKAKILCK